MADEDLRYKVVIDTSDVQPSLDLVKQQINSALQQTSGSSFLPDPSLGSMPSMSIPAPQLMPLSPVDYAGGGGGPMQWMQDTSHAMQQGFYKTGELASTANLMRQTTGMQMRDYFNPQKSAVADKDSIQLALAGFGIGYDPYRTFTNRGENRLAVQQRLADNATLGMMDYSFGEFIGAGMTAGGIAATPIGGIP